MEVAQYREGKALEEGDAMASVSTVLVIRSEKRMLHALVKREKAQLSRLVVHMPVDCQEASGMQVVQSANASDPFRS